jgi:hypothetical protein
MPVRHTLFAGLVLAVSFIQTQAVPAPPTRDVHATAPGTSTLTGTVVLTAEGRQSAVRRARVVVTTSDSSQTTDTDTNGRFQLVRLPAGSYHVVVNKFGFVPAGRPTVVDLKDNDHATTMVLMERGAAIEGRITTAEGEPAIGLTVSAGRLGYGPSGRFVVATQQTTTDDLGRYRVHTLPPGEYYLEAAPDPLRMMQAAGLQGPTSKPIRTYFGGAAPGTARLNDARVVTLDVGQQASGLDFSVVENVLSTLTVRVATAAGAPPAGSIPFIPRVQRVGALPGEVRCLLMPAGDALCQNVPPGDFWVLIAARPDPNAPVEYSATRVTVGGRDQNLAVTTGPGAVVSGRVDTDGGAPLPANLQVVALGTDYELPSPVLGQPATAPSAPVVSGGFALSGLVGPRLFRVNGLPDGWTVKSVRLGDIDITDTPTTPGATPAAPLQVILTSQTGSLGGAVFDVTGQPAVGSRVVVFSSDSRTWGARSRYIGTGEVGATGRYLLHGLLPGKYLVAVVSDLPDGAWEDPERLARLQPTAPAVTITAGATATLDWRPR